MHYNIDKLQLLSSTKRIKAITQTLFFPLHRIAFFGIIFILTKREMFKKLAFLAVFVVFMPTITHAACSRANLLRCLDSVCAINLSTNPAARCQYCGTAAAGEPATGGMRNVSVGGSTRYNITERELRKAPTDPGERYAWATTQCISRVTGCTPDDVSETYDSLIEQSCTAAGISATFATLSENLGRTKTKSVCNSEITKCIQSDTKCHTDFSGCKSDSEFAKFFSECVATITGCDEHTTNMRSELLSMRTTAENNASMVLTSIVETYQSDRVRRLNRAKSICENDSGRESCIDLVCSQRMPNKCADGFGDEISMATSLCKFYDTACATLK